MTPLTHLVRHSPATPPLSTFQRSRHPRSLRLSLNLHKMADQSTTHDNKVKEEKEEKPTISVPPPPEKPLPGDCCGSGCVRIHWIDEYQKLQSSLGIFEQFKQSKYSSYGLKHNNTFEYEQY
ncbi:uncharacterized protein [Henckelia pumila]|uniref:uncharacterized protein isoform X2 n=1 Tax=Henckelia pumila TaxID=405737 RepID=UPI003C6EA418